MRANLCQRPHSNGRETLSRRRLVAGLGASGATSLAGCSGVFGGDEGTGGGAGDDRLRVSIITDQGSAMNPYITNNARWGWLVDLVHDQLLFPSPFAGPEPNASRMCSSSPNR